MVSPAPILAAKQAMTQMNVALSVIKKGAEMDQAMVSMLDQAVQNVPVSSTRGANVNFSA